MTRALLCGAIAFALGAAPIAWIGSRIDAPAETDAYFHLDIARDYASGNFAYEPRIREGLLSRHRADREILFHALLAVPLRLGASPLTAGAVTTAFASGLTALFLWWHSRSLLVAALGIFASQTVLYRMHMCRPQGWAIACVVLGVALLMRGKHPWAALVNVAYTLVYSVPVLLLGAALLRGLAARELRPLLWVGAGSCLGLLLHPHFPDNLVLVWYQGFIVIQNALRGNPLEVPLPDELEPRPLGDYAQEFWLVFLVFGLSVARRTAPGWTSGLQAALFVLSLRIRRLVEYWVPLVALTSGPVLDFALPRRPLVLRWAFLALLALLTVVPNLPVAGMAARLQATGVYRTAGEWLRANASGAYVFNAEWDSYAELRYHGGDIWLAHGHDPVFLAACDPERHREVAAALRGEMPAGDFRRTFGARFVVARQGTPIVRKIVEGPGVRPRFATAGVVVLELEP
ncbi:MAG: hypothetical protein HY721_16690 [Planctomycetes bacterium]|nr:hypothetical protein [Planctomycetota bacterium]